MILLVISCNSKNSHLAEIEIKKIEDFGTIKVGDTIEKNIQVKNISENPLIIKKIKSSCDCTVTQLKDSVVPSNGITNIKTKFIASKENIGLISKSIVVEANTKNVFTIIYLKGAVTE